MAKRLDEVLIPFAHEDFCKSVSGQWKDDQPVYGRDNAKVLLGDFRAARAALPRAKALEEFWEAFKNMSKTQPVTDPTLHVLNEWRKLQEQANTLREMDNVPDVRHRPEK